MKDKLMKLIIHGGFLSEYADDHDSLRNKKKALEIIVKKGYEYLLKNSAKDTAAYAVSLLEDDELFNAGTGSRLQADGVIRMSAALMDGTTLNFSAVMNIEAVKNPVMVAKALSLHSHKVLDGHNATLFARSLNQPYYNPETLYRRRDYESKRRTSGTGTVGCVCLDSEGNLAASTSTGGKGQEMPGRISDSATVAGTYANKYCGISVTGVGEDIVDTALAAKIVTRVTDGMSIQDAFIKSFDELNEIRGLAGAIGIDKNGVFMVQHSEPAIAYAAYDGELLETFSINNVKNL